MNEWLYRKNRNWKNKRRYWNGFVEVIEYLLTSETILGKVGRFTNLKNRVSNVLLLYV